MHRIWFEEFRNTKQSVKHLEQAIVNHQDKFWESSLAFSGRKYASIEMPIPILVGFHEFALRWSDDVSNSHTRPLKGVSNFGGKERFANGECKPSGYLGWYGRITWSVKWPYHLRSVYVGADLFKAPYCGINTLSGGGGGHNKELCESTFSYGITMYAQDWLGLFLAKEQEDICKILSTRY